MAQYVELFLFGTNTKNSDKWAGKEPLERIVWRGRVGISIKL